MVFLIVLSGVILACLVPLIKRYVSYDPGWLLALLPAAQFLWFCTLLPAISDGQPLLIKFHWFPSLDIHFSFLIDGLSLTFSMIITLIGSLIFIYGSGYLKGHVKQSRFYMILLIFMSAMLGVVLSDNLITLFIFWELTSISSYLLIGFNHEEYRSRYVALQALLVTGGGGLAMLAGFILMGTIAGTYSMHEILQNPEAIQSSILVAPIAILILAGAFTKSAQFPFHFWLPNAMAAPTPVSAYLHSATMVKAGVFLIARVNPVFLEWAYWSPVLLTFGAVTMVFGAIWAIGQKDLKRILAFTTVSALGTLVFLTGLNNPSAYLAFGLFLIVHAFYKGGLFLVAGAIDHSTGTRDITQLKGLFLAFPFLGIAAALAGLSNAGVPPFLGFLAKEGIYVSTFSVLGTGSIWAILGLTANACLVATALMVALKPFWGKETPKEMHLHKPGYMLTAPAMLLGVLSLLTGLVASHMETWFFAPVSASLTGQPAATTIASFTEDGLIFMLSMATLLIGALIYFTAPWKRLYGRSTAILGKYGAERGYDIGLQGIINLAAFNNRTLQTGSLRHYLTWILCTVLILIGYTFWIFDFKLPAFSLDNVYYYDYMLIGIILTAAIVSVWIGRLLSAIVALGVVGYGIAIIFVFFGAPDLALTQFSIESLTIVIFVLVASKLPQFEKITSLAARTRDKILAIVTGFTMAFLALMIVDFSTIEPISSYFMDKSYPVAKGRNVVNVILVDFRALDTLGEIVVLAIAAIGIYTLLNIRIESDKKLNS